MKRVLLVSPHFPPINAADHQRVRMALPYFRESGWEPEVLTVHPEAVEGAVEDPLLARTIPSDVAVHRCGALSHRWTRKIGLASLGIRSYFHLGRAGDKLLRSGSFNLVYFSTTIFTTMALGPRWKRRFGVPYILDFQDPWLSTYYDTPGAPKPPGGFFKYGFARMLARILEPRSIAGTSAITSVSPEYPRVLRGRYPSLREEQCLVLPFGAPETDFEVLEREKVRQSIFDPSDGKRHFVYVGRGGGDMARSLRILFRALCQLRSAAPSEYENVRLHFVGTSYAPNGLAAPSIQPIAAQEGVADLVDEITARIPYFEALRVLRDSSGILLIGSDDPAYTASKLYPCILARRPILGVFHEKSSVVSILSQCGAGEVVTFSSSGNLASHVDDMKKKIGHLISLPAGHEPHVDWDAFTPYTAREMTRRMSALFDAAVPAAEPSSGFQYAPVQP